MELGLRDWLLIIGPLLIVAILIHGYIRMRRSAGRLKMDLDRNYLSRPGDRIDVDDLQLLRAELPSGGARVVKRPSQASLDLEDDVPVLMDPVADPDRELPSQKPAIAASTATARERPAHLVVLHVFARRGRFNGQQLLENLVSYGLKFGEMDIFHHHAEDNGKVQFSVVNAVEPGTFDLQKMDTMETPGVSLFSELQYQDNPLEVFDLMLETARRLATDMHGELRDSARKVMTTQTIAHCRQSVIDYTMKHG